MFTLIKSIFEKMIIYIFLIIFITFTGCSSDDSDNTNEHQAQGTIKVLSVNPAEGSTIAKGDTITASLEYSIKDMDPNKKYVAVIWFKKSTEGYGSDGTGFYVEITDNEGIISLPYTVNNECDNTLFVKPFQVKYSLNGYDNSLELYEVDWDATCLAITDDITFIK